VWGYDYYGDTRAVDTQIERIRQNIAQREEQGWALKTVYGVGYRFEVYDEAEDGAEKPSEE
ncbi:MAG: winged helix-turn-helix domain-containing protein, partial [Clostridia bacterium]|nr:winged helix-turn-helix domain-containing protein [Clostridia bacterium]